MLDRNGKNKPEINLKNEEGLFNGYIIVPNNLPSDYYFIDAYLKGQASELDLIPVMVINPKIPPNFQINTLTKYDPPIINNNGLSIQTDKTNYQNREIVKCTITLPPELNKLSIYVRKKDVLTNIMDSLLTVQKIERQHRTIGLKELEGHHLKIKILANTDGKPMKQIRAFAALPGNQSSLSTGISNEAGEIEFILPLTYNENSLFFFPEKSYQGKVKIFPIDEEEIAEKINFPSLTLDSSMAAAIQERIFYCRSIPLFHETTSIIKLPKDYDSSDFYGRPEKRYRLDEFVRFPVMEEVIAEFIHEARVKGINNSEEKAIQLLNNSTKAFFTNPALVMLDGVPVMNVGQVLEMNPLLIESIDVIPRKYYLGDYSWEGLINFKTYNKDLAGFPISSSYVLQPFQGIQENSIPKYLGRSENENRLPDLSNVIFRKIQLNSENKNSIEVQFTTGDVMGDYQIIVNTWSELKEATITHQIKI